MMKLFFFLGPNISHIKALLMMIFPIPQVGYVTVSLRQPFLLMGSLLRSTRISWDESFMLDLKNDVFNGRGQSGKGKMIHGRRV